MKLKELSNSKLMFPLREYFCCEWSEDNKVFILNTNGIDIHHFKPNPKSKQKFPEFDRTFIFPVTSNPTENSGFDEYFLLMLSKMDLFRALSDPFVTPHFSFNPPSPAEFKKASWSPLEVLTSKNCLLAALTCLGSVTIWIHTTTWSALLDVSYLIYIHLKQNDLLLPLTEDITQSLDNVMHNCKELACSAISWSDATFIENNQSYSYFATAQKSGIVYIWRLIPEEIDDRITLNTCLELKCSSNLDDVSEICWITYSESIIFLILGAVNGIVNCLHLKKTGVNLELIEISTVWGENDGITVSKIMSIKWDDKSHFGLIVKGTFLISFSIDDCCTVSNVQHKNFGNLNITSLNKIRNKVFYMSTLTGIIFYIKIIPNVNNIPCLITWVVESELSYNEFAQHGLCVSKNNALCLMLLNPCKRVGRYRGKKWCKVFVMYVDEMDPMKCLLENESNVLTDQWDILELMRVLRVKDLYENPQVDLQMDIKNCQTLYQIKLCFWLNVIWHSDLEAESITREIRKEIMSQHATHYLKKLAEKYNKTLQLSETELETISLQYKLIKVDSDCQDLNVLLTIQDLPQVIKHCEWCEEELFYPVCSSNHHREYCCITYRDVDKFLICTLCNSIAHIDLKDDNPVCTFCDSRLKYLPLSGDKIQDDAWKAGGTTSQHVDVSYVENSMMEE